MLQHQSENIVGAVYQQAEGKKGNNQKICCDETEKQETNCEPAVARRWSVSPSHQHTHRHTHTHFDDEEEMELCVCVGCDTFVMCFSYLAFPFYLPASPAAGGGVRREGGEALRVLNGFFYFFLEEKFLCCVRRQECS